MGRGNSTRLFILSELAARGAAHGHQIRREAQIGRTELWTEVAVGSIYSTIAKLEAEHLVEALRSEREGRFPERTVYAVTPEGRKELQTLRAGLLRDVTVAPDPFDLALSVAADLPASELLAIVEDRLAELRLRVQRLEHDRGSAAPHLDGMDHLLFDHLVARLHAEVAWHEVILRRLPKILSQPETGVDHDRPRLKRTE
jgi:DNA-binding PadR family transcriptional regulator